MSPALEALSFPAEGGPGRIYEPSVDCLLAGHDHVTATLFGASHYRLSYA